MPNRLSKESSPYLLQHAHNPVDWYPWGEEALEKAKLEDKPILVSIGYSACHWCHVMEKESFEDESVAGMMNAHFVNIKIDREERPDLDHIYMDAVQAMTGSGGWPLNVFLTPDAKPFYGGTYFPPRRLYNRPSWKEILSSIHEAYKDKKAEIKSQADNLTNHLLSSNSFSQLINGDQETDDPFTAEKLTSMRDQIMKTADPEEGGFGSAPKFPQTFTIQFLLREYYRHGHKEAIEQACLSLDKMIRGGIYDQVGGGFARYSTDRQWLVPHFEKMLYDQALLIVVLSEAYQLTRLDHYKQAITQSIEFIERELLSPEGGFYSALDADSEGVEGRFYVWDLTEVEEVLGDEAPLFCAFYDISASGNWEGRNILNMAKTLQVFANEQGKLVEELGPLLEAGRRKLLERRAKRVRPMLDDKILLGWNSMMILACCKAYAALGIESLRELATRNLEFIWKHFKGEGINYFHHSYKQGEARIPAFLDDYACLMAALIQLQEITGNSDYLLKARDILEWTIENFRDEVSGYFYFTHKDQEDAIIRKIEIYDGAVPSGNSMMASNLHYLSIVFNKPEWKLMAINNIRGILETLVRYPGSFGVWATQVQALAYGMNEIVITGKSPENIFKEFLRNFIPFRVFQSATSQNKYFPLLQDKPTAEHTLIFLCRDYSCQVPVTEIHELIPLLETV